MKQWMYISIVVMVVAIIIAWYIHTNPSAFEKIKQIFIPFKDTEDHGSEGPADTSGITTNETTGYAHFCLCEFDSPDEPGSGQYMKDSFMKMLEQARVTADIPFIVASGYRTLEHNAAVGGASNSAHLRGYAADIRATTKQAQQTIVDAWLAAGGTRFGIGNTFVHLDSDPSLKQSACWGYSASGATGNAWYNPNHFV